MAKSSINLQKSKTSAFAHNDRSAKNPNYIIGVGDDGQKNEFDRSAIEADILINKYFDEAKINYHKTTGKKDIAKNYHWEAVVNLNRGHSLVDVKKLVTALEKETGFRSVQISIHKDEGRINDDGVKIFNNHAHINFFTLDPKDGRQLNRLGNKFYKNDKKNAITIPAMDKTRLKKLQDITAKSLGMERGKEDSKAVRLSHKEFRAQAKKLSQKNEQVKTLTEQAKLKDKYREARETLIRSGKATQADYSALKIEHEEAMNKLEKPSIEGTKTGINKKINVEYKGHKVGQIIIADNQIKAINFKSMDASAISTLQEAKKLNWKKIEPAETCRDEYIHALAKYAARNNVEITTQNTHHQSIIDEFKQEVHPVQNPTQEPEPTQEQLQTQEPTREMQINQAIKALNDNYPNNKKMTDIDKNKYEQLQELLKAAQDKATQDKNQANAKTKFNDEIVIIKDKAKEPAPMPEKSMHPQAEKSITPGQPKKKQARLIKTSLAINFKPPKPIELLKQEEAKIEAKINIIRSRYHDGLRPDQYHPHDYETIRQLVEKEQKLQAKINDLKPKQTPPQKQKSNTHNRRPRM